MATGKLLTKAQAEAVYAAMCQLNNVNGRIRVKMGEIMVREVETGKIILGVTNTGFYHDMFGEVYETQTEFAEAYGLEL